MAFGLDFFTVAPGLRLAGDSLAYAYKFTGKGGELKDLQGLEIGLVDDPTVKLLEGTVSGYETVTDRDSVYDALVAGGLTEIVPGLALGVDSISSIETGDKAIRLAVAGQQPVLVFRNANVQEVTKVGDGGYTWDLPGATFTALKAAAEVYQSDLKAKVEQMIADRIAADGVLQTAIGDQAISDAAARQVLRDYVDAQIATDMWLFSTQGDFPAAADNHGRVVHSHADGALFFAHAGAWHQVAKEVDLQTSISSLASEAFTREAADNALSGRLDTLEADPTTATAVAAGDAATLSSANTYTDTEIATEASARTSADASLSGRLDVLEADPTTATAVAAVQSDVDQNESDSDAADAALSARLDVLEADPTTATAVAAVQSDVDANQTASESADAALSGRLDVLEADPTTQAAVDLKANKAGDTFTGDIIIDEGTGSTIKLETSDATSAGIHIEGPSGSMGYIDTTNGFANDSLQVYSANFWLRAINGGTGNIIIDGNISAPGLPGPYTNDGDAASNGVAVNSMYYDGNGHVHIRVS